MVVGPKHIGVTWGGVGDQRQIVCAGVGVMKMLVSACAGAV